MNENIILYSTGCPRCEMLKQKLVEKNIAYEEVNDVDKIIGRGILEVPVLSVGQQLLDFRDAFIWVNSQ